MPPPRSPPRGPSAAARWAVNVVVLVAAAALVVGVTAPMITLRKLVVVSNTFSLLSGVGTLWSEGQYFLFAVIAAFCLVVPCVKLAVLLRVWNGAVVSERSRRQLDWMLVLGKWSMLDVFVVAVLLATVKLGALASVEVHYGLYAFAVATVLTMLVSHYVARHAAWSRDSPPV